MTTIKKNIKMSKENKENLNFIQLMKSFTKPFWFASIMELFERWAWYGLFEIGRASGREGG